MGILENLGIFIAGIGDFLKSRDFQPDDFFGDRDFFSWDGISHQKATSGITKTNLKIKNLKNGRERGGFHLW